MELNKTFAVSQSVSVVTMQLNDSLESPGTIPDRGKDFLLHYSFEDASGISRSSHPTVTAILSQEVKLTPRFGLVQRLRMPEAIPTLSPTSS
jgi:hypothetical protein